MIHKNFPLFIYLFIYLFRVVFWKVGITIEKSKIQCDSFHFSSNEKWICTHKFKGEEFLIEVRLVGTHLKNCSHVLLSVSNGAAIDMIILLLSLWVLHVLWHDSSWFLYYLALGLQFLLLNDKTWSYVLNRTGPGLMAKYFCMSFTSGLPGSTFSNIFRDLLKASQA